MNMKFKWVVEDGNGEFCGRFVHREDAIALAREGEQIREDEVAMDFGSLMVPRKNQAGELASAPAECIGVW